MKKIYKTKPLSDTWRQPNWRRVFFVVLCLFLFLTLFLALISRYNSTEQVAPVNSIEKETSISSDSELVITNTSTNDTSPNPAPSSEQPQPSPPANSNSYLVSRVVDGDTVDVSTDPNSDPIRVRLLGVDAPESVHPTEPVECFGPESSTYLASILSGATVSLETDPTQDEYDKYGRLLAYLYLPDGTLVNSLLLEEGYAREYTFIYPYKFQSAFKESESRAKENKKGLWNSCY